MRVLAIPGSTRRDSHNARLLRHIAGQAPEGVEVVLWEDLKSIPPYDEDDDVEPAPAAVDELRKAIAGADALLIATPEYNSSIPGVLKNALDWASRPRATTSLQGKPAAVVSASTGAFGAVWAKAELRKVLSASGARIVDPELSVPHAHEAFTPERTLVSAELDAQCPLLLDALVAEAAPRDQLAAAA